jgi:D-serine deaminase-like pyridoxal phosphate-dependent protein
MLNRAVPEPAAPAFAALETPVALVDLPRLERNVARTAEYCRAHGFAWRPHAKTHKILAVAHLQRRAGAVGLTVATAREAEVMAAAGADLLLAHPPFGSARLDRLMALPDEVRLSVALDSAESLRGLAEAARAARRRVGVLVEADLGTRRAGVQSPACAVDVARLAADAPWLDYRGLMFYAGHLRMRPEQQREPIAALSAALAEFRGALEDAGLPAEVVSGGSTATLLRSHEVAGLTEVRTGTDVFHDRTTAALGLCSEDDCAYTVLATVVSTAVPGQAVIDAGSKTLSKEELRAEGRGYGALVGHPGVVLSGLYEEHGILDLSGTDWRPRLGERVRVIPNHVCVSVHLQERVVVVRGEEVVDQWEVGARGRF